MAAKKKPENYELYRRIMNEYGITIQESVWVEELAELQQALSKYIRGRYSIGNIAEEVADVEICLEQIKQYMDIDDFVKEKKGQKIERIKERLRDGIL